MILLGALSTIFLALVLAGSLYHFVLAIASFGSAPSPVAGSSSRRFLIAIAAHDEEKVIARTIQSIRAVDYPAPLVEVHVVADHCSDATAARAREAGATVHECDSGPRTGKGAALGWLFARVLDRPVDAVVVFDADTRVDPAFLNGISARLDQGAEVVQGQHVISNPQAGWFPALVWAMFLIDNRFQNVGRTNLGWSAKNMGDSICFRAEILRRLGWGRGLTEDYQLRQRLLLGGIRITYAPEARGFGEAPPTVRQARAQRLRWIRGVHDSAREHGSPLLREALERRDWALLDAWLQDHVPAYSTLAATAFAMAVVHWMAGRLSVPIPPPWLSLAWLALVAALTVYPFIGLAAERAPASAYRAILYGPFYVAWRARLAVEARLGSSAMSWVRTSHGE